MSDDARNYLVRQFETAWTLTTFHLDGLTTEECLWRPARAGLHVHQLPSGEWGADWPSHERYDIGPPSIGWVTWLGQLKDEWQAALKRTTATDLRSTARTRWPFRDRPFSDVAAWVNVELTKNAAEIGYARFLHAVSAR